MKIKKRRQPADFQAISDEGVTPAVQEAAPDAVHDAAPADLMEARPDEDLAPTPPPALEAPPLSQPAMSHQAAPAAAEAKAVSPRAPITWPEPSARTPPPAAIEAPSG
ncbi:MAG TPA: hypothetical protein PLG07_09680, partial [Phenylobacterium sp.]|nr:hypothetical protein [Phenylobacterium sp.]